MRIRNILCALVPSLLAAGGLFAQQDVILLDSLPVVYYTDGVRLAAEGRPKEALAEFERALAKDPDHAPSLYEAATLLMAPGGDEQKALEYSSRAVELDSANVWYRQQKARVLITLERYDEALGLYEGMVATDRGFYPDNYRTLAILYYQKGRTDDALATLDSAAVRMGPTPELVEMKRGMLLEAGRIDEAVSTTEEYVATAPYDETNRLALAEIYAWQRRDSLYTATLEQVVRINPDNADALSMLADHHLSRGNTALYIATLRQLFTLPSVPLPQKKERLEMLTRNVNLYRAHFFEVGELALSLVTGYPGSPEAMEIYADHAVRGGDPEGALTLLKGRLDGLEKPPLSTFKKVIEIEAWLERADSVALWSDRALGIYPDEVQIYLLLSGAQQYLNRPREAQKTLSRALRVAATDSLRSEVWGTVGTLWHERGNNRKTFAAYEKALAYNADNALVLNNYAYFLALEGQQLDRALGMSQRAVRLQENFATYLDTYAWVLYKTGDYAEARRVMQQALPLDREQNPELLIHYGDILWALNERFMASVYWKKARDAGWEPAAEIEERLARME